MMRILCFTVAFTLLAAPAIAGSGFPMGWDGVGRGIEDYEFGTAAISGAAGKQAAYVRAKAGAATTGFGGMAQCIKADNYFGMRLRLSARLKSTEASSEQLWMRVDGAANVSGGPRSVLSFNNMVDRPVKGTTDWKRYDVVLDVPAESTTICYGFFLAGGRGQAWADSLSLEPVSREIPLSRNMATPKGPVNLGFDQ